MLMETKNSCKHESDSDDKKKQIKLQRIHHYWSKHGTHKKGVKGVVLNH